VISLPVSRDRALEGRLDTEILTGGLHFGEGPRWHDHALWLSDMHGHRVLRVRADGAFEEVVRVATRPSGLGWLPDGDLLIVSMLDQRLLRWNGTELKLHADLSSLADFYTNDMVVDSTGRAYVGNFGFDLFSGAAPRTTCLICVDPDGTPRVVADDLGFPNGTVITPDGGTLIVAESFGRRLTAYDIAANGDLANRRVWAQLPDDALPDGICLDAEGAVWSASPATSECIRQLEGGEITHRVKTSQGAFACMLGGDDERTLYALTAPGSDPDACAANAAGCIETWRAPYPRAGLP